MPAESNPVLSIICLALSIYTIILLARVILSWLPLLGVRMPLSGPVRTLVDLIDAVTEPVLRPLRNLISPVRLGAVGLDLSVFILFIILMVARTAICN